MGSRAGKKLFQAYKFLTVGSLEGHSINKLGFSFIQNTLIFPYQFLINFPMVTKDILADPQLGKPVKPGKLRTVDESLPRCSCSRRIVCPKNTSFAVSLLLQPSAAFIRCPPVSPVLCWKLRTEVEAAQQLPWKGSRQANSIPVQHDGGHEGNSAIVKEKATALPAWGLGHWHSRGGI